MGCISNTQVFTELRAGDRRGCLHLVEMYQGRLIGEAMRVFHVPREDAEEIVGDVLLAVVRGVGRFEFRRGDGDFHYWVMSIFRNRMRDFIRRRALTDGLVQPYQESSLEEEGGYTETEREVVEAIVQGYQSSLRDGSEGSCGGGPAEKLKVISDVLDAMQPWERVLLRCRAMDIPYDEIAGYVGKPARHLKVYHGRVKKKFVQLLAEHFPELIENMR